MEEEQWGPEGTVSAAVHTSALCDDAGVPARRLLSLARKNY